MSLATRLEIEGRNLKPSFAAWLIALTPEDRQALEKAALNPAWTNVALMRVINAEGGHVGKDAIGAWRDDVKRRANVAR